MVDAIAKKAGRTLSPSGEQRLLSLSQEQTETMGHEFADSLQPGDVMALYGDLGSGKTTFIKGVCRGLQVQAEVTSPTFTLIHEYEGRLPVYHFDLYRIEKPQEAWELGFEEYFFGDGVTLIEWADRIEGYLPERRIEVHLSWPLESGVQNQREIVIRRK